VRELKGLDRRRVLQVRAAAEVAEVVLRIDRQRLVGRQVVGTGIPVGATIASINSPTQFTLSRNATATNATAGLTFGTLSSPYRTIAAALAAVGPSTRIVRILGNTGNDASTTDDRPYVIGTALSGTALPDGATFNVPKGVTVMIDEGAALKLRAAVINVGTATLGGFIGAVAAARQPQAGGGVGLDGDHPAAAQEEHV
jgi:hypothetical protein